jgi:hypothetical protein
MVRIRPLLLLAVLLGVLLSISAAPRKKKSTSGIYGYVWVTQGGPIENPESYYVPNCQVVVGLIGKDGSYGRMVKEGRANRFGRFTITVPPGKYYVGAYVPKESETWGWREIPVETTVWRGFYTEANPWFVFP